MHFSIAVLALVEGAIGFLAVYAAVFIRYRTPVGHLALLESELGPLWPRAVTFAVFVLLSLLAFGLYSASVHSCPACWSVGAALVVAACGLAAVSYLFPSIKLWRGVEALAVLVTGLGILLSRRLFAWVVDQNPSVHKRQ